LRGVAVAVAETDTDQRHVGLLHRPDESGPVLILELQWHHRLRNREFNDPKYVWVDPHVPARRLALVSDVCRMVWRANSRGTVPYGFGPPTDCFDEQTG